MTLGRLVGLLTEHQFLSGQELAVQLGVTRAAVWKQVETLRGLGYEIEAYPRQGYRLLSRPDRLYPWEIAQGLRTKLLGKTIEYYDELSSTNQRAKELLVSCPEGTVVLAESQTAGRGRLGRRWFSPPGTGIWMSLILRPQLPPAQLSKLTLVAAVALSQAIFAELEVRPLVKWPNDLYWNGRKLSGILTELTGEMGRLESVVLGVGLNVNQKPEDFPEEIREQAGSLWMIKKSPVDRKALLRRYLEVLEVEYFRALTDGFDRILEYCRQYTYTLGRHVTVTNGAQTFSGIAVAIDEDGGLIIDQDGQSRKVIAGDVNLTAQYLTEG
ncbi:MAG: biotin--[acetyl-CoA-carboxylase] ligase [Firmicutes bacterium]|nr:biotin--[acetyl-CoA-carboxylase] ligase [Bacillota bacterium]